MTINKVELFGHNNQREILSRLLKRNRLPQTLLFSGMKGIGKFSVAMALAKRFFCLDDTPSRGLTGCNTCKNCHLYNSGNLPDLIQVDCAEKSQSSVEEIRNLLSRVQVHSYSGKGRITIFDNAENLSVQVANLLLKQLEEPRPGVHFILVSSNPGTLPSTLLSRCHSTYFNPLSNEDMARILPTKGIAVDSDLISLSEGSVATALEISGNMDLWFETKDTLLKIATGDLGLALQTATNFARDKEGLPSRLACLRSIAREKATSLESSQDSQKRWSTCLINAITAERLIYQRNLNSNYVLNFLLQQLATPEGFTESRYDATLAGRYFIG